MQLLRTLLAASFPLTALSSLYNESNLNHTCVLSTSCLLRISFPALIFRASKSANPLLSCSAGAVPGKVDTCCVETFGGLLLSTQYWDTYTGLEAQGQKLPADTWTVHGLWPDFCNGSFTQYCDLSRQLDPAPSPNTTNGLPNGRSKSSVTQLRFSTLKARAGTVVRPYTGPNIGTFLEPFGLYDLLAFMNKFAVNLHYLLIRALTSKTGTGSARVALMRTSGLTNSPNMPHAFQLSMCHVTAPSMLRIRTL